MPGVEHIKDIRLHARLTIIGKSENFCLIDKITYSKYDSTSTSDNISGKFEYPRELADRKGFRGQSYRLYSAEVFPGKVKIDKREHSGVEWLGFREAVSKLTHEEQKDCLMAVEKPISKL